MIINIPPAQKYGIDKDNPDAVNKAVKFKGSRLGDTRGVMVFILKNQKNILTDMRVVFGGETILRDKNSEAAIIGKQLPLSPRDAGEFVEQWESYLTALSSPGSILRAELLNFIESTIFYFVE
jgi:hypothetical protein